MENGQAGQDEESTTPFVGGVTNAEGEEAVVSTHREEVDNFGPHPRWTLAKYPRDFRKVMDIGRFGATAATDDNLVMYDLNNFQCGTTIGAWVQL